MSGAAAGRGSGERYLVDVGPCMRRGGFLKVVAGGLVVAGAVRLDRGSGVATAAPARSARQDRAILNFALLLEYLKESFYSEALAGGALSGGLEQFARVARRHEGEHVAALKRALGPDARPRPAFRFGSRTRNARAFQSTAVALEDLAVAAFNGQAANLTKDALATAIEIVSVEGRHAAWIRAIAGDEPAPTAADPGEGVAEVARALKRLHIR
jgi:ferritin-like protein